MPILSRTSEALDAVKGIDALLVYHGTNEPPFKRFRTDDRSLDISIPNNLGDNVGAFFAANRNHAKQFGKRIIACELTLRNPMVFPTQEHWRDFMRAHSGRTPDIRDDEGYIVEEGHFENNTRKAIEAEGHDGVVILRPNFSSRSSDRPWYIAFHTWQIKVVNGAERVPEKGQSRNAKAAYRSAKGKGDTPTP